jgi:RpiB/LacA/LacB family sugar-phosphate isomerase
MEVKTVGIACDHAGFPLKQFVLEYLEKKGYPVKDYGTYSDASVDYPDFGHALANGIESGEVYPGIGICGSGEGIAMTLTFPLPFKRQGGIYCSLEQYDSVKMTFITALDKVLSMMVKQNNVQPVRRNFILS